MIFDDNYKPLSRYDTLGRKGNPEPLDDEDEVKDEPLVDDASEAGAVKDSIFGGSDEPIVPGEKWSSEYGNPDGDYVIESDLVVPKISTIENNKPLIVVVDDDFDTLDLLQIYLQRDYEYIPFSGPREAIFNLNQRVPDLILIDCKIHTMKATTFAEIIRSGSGKKDVPFVYIGSEEELATVSREFIPEYIVGCIKRPISRGDLQGILDRILKK